MTKDIEKRLSTIEERNKRVEADKAWETSILRRLLIALITFVLVGLYLTWLDVSRPWLNAIVPVLGFSLSTLVIQRIKALWIAKRQNRN